VSVRASAALPSPAASRKQIGIAGVVLAAIAWVITIPPIEVRTLIPSIILAVLAVCAGAWSAAGGHRKLGLEAIGVALLAVAGAEASVHSALGTVESVFTWSALVAATLRYMTPLLFAALGGVVSESSGVVNIGLEGMMLMGAFWGIYGADLLHSWVWGVLIAMISGGVLGLVHAFFSIHLRADQIVSGFGIIFLALGITGYFLEYHYGPNGTPLNISMIPNVKLPLIQHVGFFGVAIGDANLMTWVVLAMVPGLTFFLFRTRWGLRLRAVGEKPRAADTLGLPVLRIRYAAVITSGVLSALGGAYLSVGFVGSFSNDMTNGRGFIALAAMIFGKWKPWGALWATLLFGFGSAMADRVSSVNPTLGTLFESLPYVVTLIAVAGLVGRSRAPAADGIPYVRE
jgi:simple sugar transport system permease protein